MGDREIDVFSMDDFTDEELLKLTRRAIAFILAGGQSYTVMGQSYTRADLGTLTRMRDELEDKIDRKSGGDIGYVHFEDR